MREPVSLGGAVFPLLWPLLMPFLAGVGLSSILGAVVVGEQGRGKGTDGG